MEYKVLATTWFEKELKRLLKKFPSLKSDLASFKVQLLKNVRGGTPIGGGVYKWRLSIKSKAKGKSGGMRVITYLELDILLKDTSNIFLLAIYDKSETSTISKAEIKRRVSSIILE